MIRNCNKGMTYVELIVVLSIFAIMSSVILFNYSGFQAKVDIKTLASDIALKIVEAQKSAMSGKWDSNALPGWKPAYGVYFDTSNSDEKKKFSYFADLNNDNFYLDPVLDQPTITKNNFISTLEIIGCPPQSPQEVTNLGIVFKRPDSNAKITSGGNLLLCASYAQITVSSPSSPPVTAKIKIYSSGRIQIN